MNTASENALTLQKVIELTQEVFGQEVQISPGYDYEFPDDVYTRLEVELRAPPDKIVELENIWAEKVNEIAPGDLSFRLLLTALP